MTEIDHLARAAADEISGGDVVGLGTGRAASRAIRAIAARIDREGLKVRGVPTSVASADLARSLGIPLIPLEDAGAIDVLLDGVDELAPDLSMLKGQGGAMTREKIVAHASSRRVYLMQRSKSVTRLGERCAVPVEVLASGRAMVEHALRRRGIIGAWRGVTTDDGNPILDCPLLDTISAVDFAALLDATPGAVGHGLFLTEADRVLIEDESGAIEARER